MLESQIETSNSLSPTLQERNIVADDRSKAIELALSGLEKQFGKGSIMRLGSKDVVPISVISTGSISFDAALGVGGVPRARVIDIFGPESSGNTPITLQIISKPQKPPVLPPFSNPPPPPAP